mmetsp:Transcript_27951/g.94105  ORF Transcript_27951/g.94105 Transcript_27951/m.94105 type:complete len:292 (-) Transcript_27951:760-1635(-)
MMCVLLEYSSSGGDLSAGRGVVCLRGRLRWLFGCGWRRPGASPRRRLRAATSCQTSRWPRGRRGSELNLEKVGKECRRVRLEDGVVEEALEEEALESQIVLVKATEPTLPPLQAPPRPQRVLVVHVRLLGRDGFREFLEVRRPAPEAEGDGAEAADDQVFGVDVARTHAHDLVLRNPDHDGSELAAALALPRLGHRSPKGRLLAQQGGGALHVRVDNATRGIVVVHQRSRGKVRFQTAPLVRIPALAPAAVFWADLRLGEISFVCFLEPPPFSRRLRGPQAGRRVPQRLRG